MGKPNIRLFLYFLFTLIKYFELKAFRLARSLTFYKKWFLRRLLWRRGLLFRPATHFGVAMLALLAIIGGAAFGPLPSLANQTRLASPEVVSAQTTVETSVPDNRPRAETIDYTISSGDTLSSVASKYNVSVETIKWANDLSSDNVSPGQKVTILPVSGVQHKVAAGETIESIAKKHNASSQAILDFPFNDIPDDLSLKVGQTLIIPDGKPIETAKPAGRPSASPNSNFAQTPVRPSNGGWIWPVSGVITQYPSWYHMALDIAGPIGTPVVAAKAGRVATAENLWYGYGHNVTVDHGGGVFTEYAHMIYFIVKPGQWVAQGQVLGYRGSTGRSTGPHLHFEIRIGGNMTANAVNLLRYLP